MLLPCLRYVLSHKVARAADSACLLQPATRKVALINLTSHPGFRLAHPREEHFVPLYVAAGAAGDGDARVLSGIHGANTVVFGI